VSDVVADQWFVTIDETHQVANVIDGLNDRLGDDVALRPLRRGMPTRTRTSAATMSWPCGYCLAQLVFMRPSPSSIRCSWAALFDGRSTKPLGCSAPLLDRYAGW
jgi:hypothetical protein